MRRPLSGHVPFACDAWNLESVKESSSCSSSSSSSRIPIVSQSD